MRRRSARILAVFVVLLAVVVAAAGAVAVTTVRSSFPQTAGEVRLPGLLAPVDVRRDAAGIPQIYAETTDDLFRAQGYVHAQDRFFEMDFRRHLTSGRLAEWFGKDLLETDMFVRTMGWRRIAAQEFERLAPTTKRYLEAYAQGVNSYLAEHKGSALSVEYTRGILGPREEVDLWTPVDSLAWLKAMAWDLRSNLEDEVTRVLASTKVSPERVAELYPDYPYEKNPPIVAASAKSLPKGKRSPPRVTSELLRLSAGDIRALSGVRRTLEAAPGSLAGRGGDRAGIGSNSWVVSGSRTASGKPLLANDPHLAASIPSVWHQVGLHCRRVGPQCPFDVAGFSFAGVPGVVIGHNHKIAWGFTNLGPDVSDLYLERIDGNTYLYDGRKVPLDIRRETIRVKGGADVTIEVRSTRHGPLLSDVDRRLRKVATNAPAAGTDTAGGLETGVALRWTALDPGRTGDAIFALNAATDWASFRKAAALLEVPSQNLVYADTAGHIGYQAPGRIPIRERGSGKWPVPGWTSAHEWKGWVPFDALPSVIDPPSGILVTANNAVIGPDYRYPLADVWAYGYRSKRISDLLEQAGAAGELDAAAMSEIQLDTRNGFAETLVPHLLRVGVDDFTADGQRLLRGWDGEQTAGSAAAAYYNAVWRNLLAKTFADELPKDARPSGGDRWYEVVGRLLDDPDNVWWDDVRTKGRREQRDDILRAAMVSARLELTKDLNKDTAKWSWGRMHTLELRNQVFGSSGIGPLEALYNRGPYRLPGGSDAVLAAGWNAAEGYTVTSVPSMRMVVDLGDLDQSRWINLSGVSGHVTHPHYDDQTALWAAGKTLPWRFGEAAVHRATKDILTLGP